MAIVNSIFYLLFGFFGHVFCHQCLPKDNCGHYLDAVPACGGPNEVIDCLKNSYTECHDNAMAFANAVVTEKFLTKIICEDKALREEFVKENKCWTDPVFHYDCFMTIALHDKYANNNNRTKACDAIKQKINSCKNRSNKLEGCDNMQNKLMDMSLKSVQCGAVSATVNLILLVFTTVFALYRCRE